MIFDFIKLSELSLSKEGVAQSFDNWWNLELEKEIKEYSPIISELVDRNCISWSSFSEYGSYTTSFTSSKNNSTRSMDYGGTTRLINTTTYRLVELYGSRGFSINLTTFGNKVISFRITYRLNRGYLKSYDLTSYIDDNFYDNFSSSMVHKLVIKYLTRILKRSENDLSFLLKSASRVLCYKYSEEIKTGYISSPSNGFKFLMTSGDKVPKNTLGYFQVDFKYLESSSTKLYLSRNPEGILVKVKRNICNNKEEVPYLIKSWNDILRMGENELANLFIEIAKKVFK